MRKQDHAPVGHTCPKIDSVISMVHGCYMSSEPMSKGEYNEIDKVMEQIRSDNAELRDWGNQQCESVSFLERDNDSLTALVKELREEVEELKQERDYYANLVS